VVNILLTWGSILSNGKHLDTSGTTSSNSEVGGYSIMQADNMVKVEELLKNNPHLTMGEDSYIEIHEKMPLPKCKGNLIFFYFLNDHG